MNEDLSFRIKFIKEVERNPCLYDHSHENYNSKKAIDSVWAHIAQMFGEHGSDCKSKWRSIRSAYIRSLNTNSSRTSRTYYLAHHLRFLNPFLKCKPRSESVHLSAPEDEDPNDSNQTVDDLLYVDHPLHVQIRPERTTVKEEPEDVSNDDENEDSNPLCIAEVRNKRPLQIDRTTTPNCSTNNTPLFASGVKKRKPDTDSDRSSCEHYALSLVPYLETMTERQQLAFQRGVIDLIEKIKYGVPT